MPFRAQLGGDSVPSTGIPHLNAIQEDAYVNAYADVFDELVPRGRADETTSTRP